MNNRDKRTFIRNLCNSVRNELVGKVKAMPEEWDGHELRELIAEKFEHERSRLMREDRRRARAYRNETYTRNL